MLSVPPAMKLTPTERKILDVLSDGLPHTRAEVHACLPDELGDMSNVWVHISNLRGKLRATGRDVACVYRNRRRHYQLFRLLAGPAGE